MLLVTSTLKLIVVPETVTGGVGQGKGIHNVTKWLSFDIYKSAGNEQLPSSIVAEAL